MRVTEAYEISLEVGVDGLAGTLIRVVLVTISEGTDEPAALCAVT